MILNPEQQRAVNHTTGPLLILAGAGSGKTRVLTERIVHLIESSQCMPYEILAVTFTNKASAEMRSRIEARIGPAARDIWVNTFHAACLKILRCHAEEIGLSREFAIYDDADQMSLIKKVLIDLNISEKLMTPRAALEKISRSKDSCIEASQYPSRDFYQEKVAKVYMAYDNALHKNGALDFGDLIMLTVKLFRNRPDTLLKYQSKFKFIMVDEYQDTNHSQYELMRMLAEKHRNIAVVGDPDQSIYAWRGADISNILEFERDFKGAKVIKLEQNYRSTKTILAASDAVIENNESRKPKTLWTENEEGDLIRVIGAQNEREEARLVVEEIRAMNRLGTKLKDIAIFYRTNAQSRMFEDELMKEGVPYTIFGGVRFYDRTEVKNIVSYLKLINNPSDDISLRRIINVPARGIGKTTVDKLVALASASGIPLMAFIRDGLHTTDLNQGTRKKLGTFADMISLMSHYKDLPLPEFVTKVIERTGYLEALAAEKTEEADDRMENIDELISAVTEAHKQNDTLTLSELLDQIALVSEIDKYDESQDKLPLMTLHLCKGLEFKNVFIVGLEEGVLPHIRSVNDNDQMEEERRLFYVGMTRAESALFLAHANERMIRGSYNYNIPSRFLEEIPEKYTLSKRVAAARPNRDRFKNYDTGQDIDIEFGQTAHDDPSMTSKHQFAKFFDEFSQVPDHEMDHGQKPGYRVGQRVKHPTFGEGVVRKAEGTAPSQRLIVQFKSGEIKKLSAQYAQLISI